MADFKKAEFGDKFIFKPTGEICEYISSGINSVDLRPVDYEGLMVYSEVVDCLNAIKNWEVYEEVDDWNVHEQRVKGIYQTRNVDYYEYGTIRTLKEKILEDAKERNIITDNGVIVISMNDIDEILNKRFGF